MAPNTSGGRGKGHGTGVVLRHVFFHPAHALVFTVPVVLSVFFSLDFLRALLALLITEVAVLAIVARLPWVRQAVDEKIQDEARREAAAARATLLLRMSDDHRREL